ncbi:hypothetical protein SBC1_49570 (plasmid) [Caballeronia sp. SBC1]|nr:hypothetical protein SBC2_38400 [Caballeronia sp. SBC2]QIN64917.1 hypothetical protein SBC1_49570 [Caballeronia sp. SBC1]
MEIAGRTSPAYHCYRPSAPRYVAAFRLSMPKAESIRLEVPLEAGTQTNGGSNLAIGR